jgi:Flp pilus assembly protein TadB
MMLLGIGCLAAVWWVVRSGSQRTRLDAVLRRRPESVGSTHQRTLPRQNEDRPLPIVPVCVGTAAVVLFVAPWPWSVVLAIALVAVLVPVLRRLEPSARRRRHQEREDAMPLALDLLAASWAAGVPPQRALDAVARAVHGPLADDLRHVVTRMELGATGDEAWRGIGLDVDGASADAARVLIDAIGTGIAPAAALRRTAEVLREQRRRRGEAAARTVAVRVTGPLGLCFLPAFVLLGIAPAVIGALLPALG